jgi:hypothetical protein
VESLPLLAPADAARPMAYLQGRAVSLAQFWAHVQAIAQRLPGAGSMLNLCEDRYRFLAAYAPDFMSTKVLGNINIGLIFGLLQFVSTFAITMAYARWADREFDPTADRLRAHIEAGEVK